MGMEAEPGRGLSIPHLLKKRKKSHVSQCSERGPIVDQASSNCSFNMSANYFESLFPKDRQR
uniref:Uncharacterized protein n=1 Tax=Anguilla anguilla TaxID=7936 RepID=A0A0E9WLC1_ANGAN